MAELINKLTSGQYRASCKQEQIFSNFHVGMSSCRPKFYVGSLVKGLLDTLQNLEIAMNSWELNFKVVL